MVYLQAFFIPYHYPAAQLELAHFKTFPSQRLRLQAKQVHARLVDVPVSHNHTPLLSPIDINLSVVE